MAAKDLCRLCGESNEKVVWVFGEYGTIQQVQLKVEKVLQIYINQQDVLPKMVCMICLNRLDNAFNFHTSCHKTQIRLQQSQIDGDKVLNIKLNNSDFRDVTEFDLTHESTIIDPEYSDLKCNDDEYVMVPSDMNMEMFVLPDDSKSVANVCDSNSIPNSRVEENRNTHQLSTFQELHEDEANTEDDIETSEAFDSTENENTDDSADCSDDNSEDSDYVPELERKSNRKTPQKCVQIDSDLIDSSSGVVKKASFSKNSGDGAFPNKDKAAEKQNNWICSICGMCFIQKFAYQEHLNVHSGKRPFCCRLCEASFRKRQDLNVHLRNVHADRTYNCTSCKYVAKSRGKLTQHIKSTHEKPYSCDLCDYRAGEKGKMKRHLANKHNGDVAHVCEVCGSGFRTRAALIAHRKHIHDPEPKVCQTCGIVCPSLPRYYVHTARCGKRYPCDKCDQSYSTKESLKDHMNKHLNIKPYKCDVCNKDFYQQNRLHTHMYVHKGAAYRCDICHQAFNRKDNMKSHMRRHVKIE